MNAYFFNFWSLCGRWKFQLLNKYKSNENIPLKKFKILQYEKRFFLKKTKLHYGNSNLANERIIHDYITTSPPIVGFDGSLQS
jgi:hypothetical protein